ncbi:sortase [Marinilactibacillus psychrotolerans]|uniref:Sortase n=2 Tax=Marinilactibacillus psychrotolerans TaxID=191770 RepID=A0A5R9C8A1_9LACT|nr:sortase [Marinilactibacillus psychrotolerans]TLQ09444.1 sortase [Marinilactibacillus psychrotolerans]
MKENQIMGEDNYALAGHNWRDNTTLLFQLHRFKKGVNNYLKDLQKEYEYRVDKIVMVNPNGLNVIDETETVTLTLVTCNHAGAERLIVQAALVNS